MCNRKWIRVFILNQITKAEDPADDRHLHLSLHRSVGLRHVSKEAWQLEDGGLKKTCPLNSPSTVHIYGKSTEQAFCRLTIATLRAIPLIHGHKWTFPLVEYINNGTGIWKPLCNAHAGVNDTSTYTKILNECTFAWQVEYEMFICISISLICKHLGYGLGELLCFCIHIWSSKKYKYVTG